MTKQSNYDEILKKGLDEYYQRELDLILPEDEINHTFSEEYEREKEKLLKKIDRPLWKYTNTVAKRAAMFLICFLIASASALSVDAVREKIVEFFYTVFDTHTYVETDNLKEQIEKVYTINDTIIPADYVLTDRNNTSISSMQIWESKKNISIILDQYTNISQTLNSENTYPDEKIINDTPCLVIKQENIFIIYWEFDGYGFTLHYPPALGEDFAENIVGKLVEIK